MSTFSHIKKLLEKEDACVVSKNGAPLYVAMRWEKYQQMAGDVKMLRNIRELKERQDEEDASYDVVDINSIPV